ncbi:hypothetical protein [Emticicia oligotrophica]|uniref:hypothetical protein n=1 Tax=Emticicia oligotrophica TaxID=312279 RepID=UPI00273C0AC0|nr:hypothetical protein [Emticicia oligotrophica]
MGLFELPLVSMAVSIIIIWALMAILTGFVHEAIAQWLAERGRFMRKWLMSQMNDKINGINWASLIYLHGSVDLLTRDIKKPTGNISGKLFAQTLLEVVGKSHAAHMHAVDDTRINYSSEILKNLKHALMVLKPSDVITMMQQGFAIAETKAGQGESREQVVYDEMVKHIETWFSEFEWRMSDWYKRKTKVRLFMLGTVISLLMNVNSIELFHYVKHNAEGRERIIEYYEKNIQQLEALAIRSESPQSFDILKKEIDQQKTRIEHLAKSADMPVGFDKSVFSSSKITSIRDFVVLILGACFTGFAVSFGAPFWFDLLRKIYTLKKV